MWLSNSFCTCRSYWCDTASCRVHHTVCSSTWPRIFHLVVSIIQYVPAHGHTFFILSCPSYIMFQPMATHSSSCRVHHTVCTSTWPHIFHLVVSIIQYVPAHGHTFFILSCPSYIMFQPIATHCSSCRVHRTVCSSTWPHILRLVVSIIQYVPAHGHTLLILSCPSYIMFQHMATHFSSCRVHHILCSSPWPHILRLVVSITQCVPAHGHTFFVLSCPSYSMFQHMATHSSSCHVHHTVYSSTWPHILHLVVSIIQYVPAHGHTFFTLSCPSYSMFQPMATHSSSCRVHHTVCSSTWTTHSSSCRVHHTVCSSTWPHILHLVVSIIQYLPAHGHTFFILSCPSYSMFQHMATHSSPCRVHHTVCSSTWPHILHLVVSIIQYVPAHGHTFFILSCPSYSMFQHMATHSSSCRVHHTVCSSTWPHILHLVVSIIQYVPAHGHTFFILSCPSYSMFQHMATHSSPCRVHHRVCSSTLPHIPRLVVSIIQCVPAHGHTFFTLSCPSYSMFQHIATHSSSVHHTVCSSTWPHILHLVVSIIQYVPAHCHTFFTLSCPSYSMFQHMATHSSPCRVHHTVCSSTWPHILHLVVSIIEYVPAHCHTFFSLVVSIIQYVVLAHGHTFFILSCPSYSMFQRPHIHPVVSIIHYVPAHGHTFFVLSCPSYIMFQHMATHSSSCRVSMFHHTVVVTSYSMFQHMATHSSPCRVHHTVCSSTWPHILRLVVSIIQYVPTHGHTFFVLSCPSYSMFQHMATHSSPCRVHHTVCSSTWPHIRHLVVSIIQYVPTRGHTFFVLSCPSYIMFQHMATYSIFIHTSSCRVHHTVCSSTWPHILRLVVSIIQYVPAHGHTFFTLSCPSYSMFQHMATHSSSCRVHHTVCSSTCHSSYCRVHHTVCSSTWPHILRLVVSIIQYVPAHGHTFFVLSCPSYSMFQHMATHSSSCRVHHTVYSSTWPHILRLVVSIIQYVPAHGHTFFILSCPSYSMFQHMATHSSSCRVHHTIKYYVVIS